MSDQEAIHQLKRRNMEGLETLINRYQIKAIRAAFFIVQDRLLAEDVVQETFLHIYQHIQQFDETRPFEPYLMRSVINTALNLARRREKEISLDPLADTPHLETLLSDAAEIENQAEFTERKREILAAIAALSPRQRAAVVQRYYLEMDEKEMATNLKVSSGTVKWLLHQARNRLRDLLEGQREAK